MLSIPIFNIHFRKPNSNGDVDSVWRFSIPKYVWAFFFATLFFAACGDDVNEQENKGCKANVDCLGTAACVYGECISDVADCQSVGAFTEVTKAVPQNADSVTEMHVTVDTNGAVHYCYSGQKDAKQVAYYGRQIDSETIVEEEVTVEDEIVQCGGLIVTDEGVPYLFLRSPPAFIFRRGDKHWETVWLDGLDYDGARAALRSKSTVISLNQDETGVIYLGLSLGYQLGFQPLFLADLKSGVLYVLANGWSEKEEHTITGHAPQILSQNDGVQVVLGQIVGFQILLADRNMNTTAAIDGAYPRAVTGNDGTSRVTYIDQNSNLHLDLIENAEFKELAVIGRIDLSRSDEGQLPWEMAIDAIDTAHLLIEDHSQETTGLIYRKVDAQGNVSEPVLLSEQLDKELKGMQRFGLHTDVCGRPTAAMVESKSDKDEQKLSSLPLIKIVEER
jgi:hypothetical protein